jgi:hypothetical protein
MSVRVNQGHLSFVICHFSLVNLLFSFRGDPCYFVDRLLWWEIKNDPRNHTNGHEKFVSDISWYLVDRF